MQQVEGRQPHLSNVSSIATAPSADEPEESELRTALKHSSAALKADGVPFALGGGYALRVRGAPEPVQDVDLVVAEEDVEPTARSLESAGFTVERPPEDWLERLEIAPAPA